MLTVMGVLGVGGYLYFRLDDEIRRQVEVRFANHYRDFHVKVGSARFDPDRGIAIDNFSLTPKSTDGSSPEPVLTIDELYLAGKLRIDQLVTNQMQMDMVVVRHAHVRMVRQADGVWNTSALLPLPHFSDQTPKITIEDATATVEIAGATASKPWSLQGVNLKLAPLAANADAAKDAKRFHIEGNANGPPAREIQIDGELDASNGALDVMVTANGVDLTPELFANLPDSAQRELVGVDVAGQANVTLHLLRRDANTPPSWSSKFNVERGRFVHQMLPEPLTEVSLSGQADPQHLAVERLTAKCGPATIAAAVNRTGWTANAPLALSAKVVGFALTERLQTALPESYARIWQRFRPIGTVDADVQVTFDEKRGWKPTLTATCRGISLTDVEKFNYVVEHTTGKVIYRPAGDDRSDQLHLDLTGVGGGRPIKIDAQLTHLAPVEPQGVQTGEGVAAGQTTDGIEVHAAGYRGVRYSRAGHAAAGHPLGYVELSGSDIPLHDRLMAALPEKAKELVNNLQAEGAIDFRFRAEWKDLAQPNADTTLDIPLKDCRVRYTRFSLPLQHVHGVVKGVKSENWSWTLSDIEARGSNDATVVKCRGGVVPYDSGCEVDLTFEATNVPLDDIFKRALPAGGQQAWSELNPQGYIDFTAHITEQPNELEPHVEVALRPREKTVSIQPRMFAYRLGEVEGVATYKRGRVDWQNIIAHHDRSVYSMESGSWQVSPEGGWQCNFTNVNVDRLTMNRELLDALPPALQGVITKLQPSGSIGLYKGNLIFAKPAQSEGLSVAWDVSLECQQAAIQGAVPIQGINGGVRLIGRSDGRTAFSSGELALDSILCKNVQLTNVRGPFWADQTRCLFGEPACSQQNQQPRRMTADAYGGSLTSNIELTHGANPSYRVDVHLGGANLARFASERLGGPNDMNGTISGKLVVAGTGSSTQTLRGSGELHVVDANIYELPILVAMLKVLRNRSPDSTAFNRCDMEFEIQGEHIQFKHLNLLGDAASLYGTGESDFSRKLNIDFYTLIGPADLPIPFVKWFAGNVSKQGLQLKVAGTLDDPKIERKPFPAINDMLSQLQTDIQNGASTITPSTAASGSRPSAK